MLDLARLLDITTIKWYNTSMMCS